MRCAPISCEHKRTSIVKPLCPSFRAGPPFRVAALVRVAAFAALGLLVAACSNTPGARKVPPGASFAANILADGTKLFTFSTHLLRPSLEAEHRMLAADNEQAEGRQQRRRTDLAETSKRALQMMLQENGYCREGYVLHELYEDRTDYVIRGECRDAASDADRARFPGRG